MIRTIDRESGIFSRETCDKINIKSTEIYENINKMNIPVIRYKEPVTEEIISIENKYNGTARGLRVGHLIQFDITIMNPDQEGWNKIGELQTAPIMDLLYSNTNGGSILKVERGSTDIWLFTTESPVLLYGWYVI